jgi:hypothetical protein
MISSSTNSRLSKIFIIVLGPTKLNDSGGSTVEVGTSVVDVEKKVEEKEEMEKIK